MELTFYMMKSVSKKTFLDFFYCLQHYSRLFGGLFFPVGMKLILGRWEVTTLIGPSSLMSTPLWGR